MLFWTIMPIENLFEEDSSKLQYKEVEYKGITLIVENISESQCRVIKILSTAPEDYMCQEIQPGNILNYSITQQIS
ncbi:YlzJ-like family protein [Anaerosinus massiliensis]|uniref:YlzJ-like family protein n=1 Tax=Massilibacillus massiliensis TaxID=1806837 RepID=UPI000DA60BDD|nr:YlzJ-like family protein [Massilibacillus massiliensis]